MPSTSRRPSVKRLAPAALVSLAAVASLAAPSLAAPTVAAPTDADGVRTRLTIMVSGSGHAGADGTFRLRCAPVGGGHPAARAACGRLDELADQGVNPFAPVPGDMLCTLQSGGPATARITGIWRGRSIDAAFNRSGGCEISRWNTLRPVLPEAG
ncbi:SSI family serine proteinase inhibitor [Streptomyces sp. NPDC058195]|uniref:SSI family serine proteinase inhibitor n=1 Tax=Streptomyces sp. NPDC058195 TaxID=3346375 RepID=UPI0036E5D272